MKSLSSRCSLITLNCRNCERKRAGLLALGTRICLHGTTGLMWHSPKITPITTLNIKSSLIKIAGGNRTSTNSSTYTKRHRMDNEISDFSTRSQSTTGRKGLLFPQNLRRKICKTSSRMVSFGTLKWCIPRTTIIGQKTSVNILIALWTTCIKASFSPRSTSSH